MLNRIYLGFGIAMLSWTAIGAFTGQEFRSANRTLPTPGQLAVASNWLRSSSGSSRSGSHGTSSSSSTRSGGGIFGGK